LIFWSASALAVPPTPPAFIVLEEKIIEGQLEESQGMVNLQVRIEVSRGVKTIEVMALLGRIEGPLPSVKKEPIFQETRKVERAEGLSLSVPIKIAEPGHYEVEIRIEGQLSETDGFSDRKIRHVVVDEKGAFRIMTGKQFIREKREERESRFRQHLEENPDSPDIRLLFGAATQVPDEIVEQVRPLDVPAHKRLEVYPVGPSEFLQQYTIDMSEESWQPEDPITVRGRLVYLDFDGVWRPLVNVSVNVWDDDFGPDEHLGVTGTNWNGDWSMSVNNNKLENTRIRVQDCDGIDSTYEWESGVHDDLSDGIVLDFGTQTGVEWPNTMQIWGHLNLAWNHAVTAGGQDPGFVDTCYPEDGGTHWDRFWEEIDIGEEFNDGPDVVTHEYGHAIMWYAYGDDNPSPGGSHTFDDCPQDQGLAWSEGWATGFMLSARPDGTYTWHEGGGSRNIENFNASCQTGEANEGRVAAAINDMRDAPNDCNGGTLNRGRDGYCDDNSANRVGLATMLRDTLWNSWHDDFLDFWYGLAGELTSAQRPPAHEIMYYNWMSVTEPGSCAASRVAAREARKPETMLDGLRSFRNIGMKGFSGGEQLINMYYRNSPEIAIILLRDGELREQALSVMSHFSKLGQTLRRHEALEKRALKDRSVIPGRLMTTIQRLISGLEKNGSPELKQDLHQLRLMMDKNTGLTIREIQQKVGQAKTKHDKTRHQQLRYYRHNPASAEAVKSKELREIILPVKPPADLEIE
jgi:hypothetical protein